MSTSEVCTKLREVEALQQKFCSSADCCALDPKMERPGTEDLIHPQKFTNELCCKLTKVVDVAQSVGLMNDATCPPFMADRSRIQPADERLAVLEHEKEQRRIKDGIPEKPQYAAYLSADLG